MYFFKERIENAYNQVGFASGSMRVHRGKNDTIYDRLPTSFNFEQAMSTSKSLKGVECSQNSVRMMLKNWNKQGLVTIVGPMQYQKIHA